MRVSVENSGVLERKMTVSVPAEELEKEVSARISRLRKTAKLPGFRPGKVPLKIVERQFGGQVIREVAGELIQSSLRDAFIQEKLNPVGGPNIEPKTMSRGQDLEYIATFEVFPEVPEVTIEGAQIDRPVVEIADADIDRTLKNIQRQRVDWKNTEDAAGSEDRVTIDFKATVDGESFQGGEAEDFPVVLGSGAVLGELEKQLVDRKPGDTIECDVTFPEDYGNKEIAGKVAKFAVTVKEVAKPEYPAIDTEFAKSFGIEDGNLDTLRADIRANLERELADRIRSNLRDQVLRALVDGIEVEVPRQLVENEIDVMLDTFKKQLERQGLPGDTGKMDRENFQPEAHRRVKLGLLMREFIRAREIKPDDDLVREKLMTLAANYEDPDAFVRWYYEDKSRLEQVEGLVLEEMAVENLLKDAKQVDTSQSFAEFMKPAEPSAAQ